MQFKSGAPSEVAVRFKQQAASWRLGMVEGGRIKGKEEEHAFEQDASNGHTHCRDFLVSINVGVRLTVS